VLIEKWKIGVTRITKSKWGLVILDRERHAKNDKDKGTLEIKVRG
jgi:hypothetical protein